MLIDIKGFKGIFGNLYSNFTITFYLGKIPDTAE